jgi:hypothetical protein
MYNSRIDGSDTELIFGKAEYDYLCDFNIVGDCIYYTTPPMGDNMYKINIDGTQDVQLNDNFSYSLSIVSDWIYYHAVFFHDNVGETGGWSYHVYKMKTDGTENLATE